MTPEQRSELIAQARRLLREALTGGDLPQIDAILRSADDELHWAQWNLGQTVPLRPDLDAQIET